MANVSNLLDTLLKRLAIKSDAALAREIEVSPSVISKLRSGKRLGAVTALRMHEYLGISLKEIGELSGQTKFR